MASEAPVDPRARPGGPGLPDLLSDAVREELSQQGWVPPSELEGSGEPVTTGRRRRATLGGALLRESVSLRGIVHIPQGRRMFPMLSVEENLEVGAYTPRSRPDRKALLQEMYTLFPKLHTLRRQLAGSLSGGEQQMLAIARGLMARPKLLTVDEPSLGLAPMLVENTFKMIERINRNGVAILLVEENVVKALTLAHRAFVIENGRMLHAGPRRRPAEKRAFEKSLPGNETGGGRPVCPSPCLPVDPSAR